MTFLTKLKTRKVLSTFMIAALATSSFAFTGCDLGTYGKRQSEKVKPAVVEEPADNAAEDAAESQ